MKYLVGAAIAGVWVGAFFSLFILMQPTAHSAGFLIGLVLVFLPMLASVLAFLIETWKSA